MHDQVIRSIFAALVERFGGVDAAAAQIEAACGSGSKGHVSKMCSGHTGVTVSAFVAIEDALSSYPLTTLLAERALRGRAGAAPLQELAACASAECGEAVGAVIRAFSAASPGGGRVTEEERAQALARVQEARQALDRLAAGLASSAGAV